MSSTNKTHHNSIFIGIFSAVFGVFIYSRGFLLTRSELTNTTDISGHNISEFQRVVLLLVDGLFTGFLPPLDNSTRMPYFRSLISQKNYSKNFFLTHFIADPPTTTMQRLKALLTGSMPTFIDAGSNFGGSELHEDNLIRQWNRASKKLCFVGDEVWTELVPNGFNESYPFPAFNIKDLDTVDTAVKEYILREIGHNKCDILIGHMLGIDHCGHTFGRLHPEMDRKLVELDDFLGRLIPQLRPTDLVIAFGDHGMTATGDHGGDSDAEVDAALFAYTPSGFLRSPTTASAEKTNGPISSETVAIPAIEQINLVPTLAVLTGTPIPFSNLGIVISQLLNSDLLGAVNENFKQMFAYAKEYHHRFGLISIPHDMEQRLIQNATHPCSSSSMEACVAVMQTLRDTFRTQWTRMDVKLIALGFFLTTNSLLAFLLLDNDLTDSGFTCSLATVAAVILALSKFTSIAFFPLILTSSRLSALCLWRISHLSSFGTSISSFILALSVLTSCSNSFVIQEAKVLSFLLQTMLLVTTIFTVSDTGVFSIYAKLGASRQRLGINASILLCITLLWAGRYIEVCREESPLNSVCVTLGTTDKGVNTGPTAAWFLTRFSALSGERLRRLAGPRLLVAVAGLCTALFYHRNLLTAWGNLQMGGVVGVLLSAVPSLGVLGLSFLWLLDALIASAHSGGDSTIMRFLPLQITFLPTLRINLARVLFLLSGSLFLVLVRRPLLLTSVVPTTMPFQTARDGVGGRGKECGSHIRLSGLSTVYTAWLLTVLVVSPLLVLFVLLGDIYVWPCLAILVCLLLPPLHLLHNPRFPSLYHKPATPITHNPSTQVISLLHAGSSWTTAIYACLLGQFGFYCLGHQPTFPSIPWEAAFAVLEGDQVAATTASFLPGALVLGHTFAAQILVTVALPLLIFVPLHRFSRGSVESSELLLALVRSRTCSLTLRKSFVRLFRRYLIAHFSLFIGHLLCTFLLRRHLMVWKIFAPRLVFSFCCVGVVSCTVFIVQFLVVHRLHATVEALRRQLFPTSGAC